jgi:hypothetical protein
MRASLLFLPLLLIGCATPRVPDTDVQAAADDLQGHLDVPGRLLAAAALVHAETGAFPSSAFDLLGTEEATRTGASALRLSSLTPNADRDGFTATFTTPAQPNGETEQQGDVGVRFDGDGRYTATFRLMERNDTDLRGGRRYVAQSGRMVVRSVGGTLALSLDDLNAALAAGTPVLPLRPGSAINVAFDHSRSGARVGSATVPILAAPTEPGSN